MGTSTTTTTSKAVDYLLRYFPDRNEEKLKNTLMSGKSIVIRRLSEEEAVSISNGLKETGVKFRMTLTKHQTYGAY